MLARTPPKLSTMNNGHEVTEESNGVNWDKRQSRRTFHGGKALMAAVLLMGVHRAGEHHCGCDSERKR